MRHRMMRSANWLKTRLLRDGKPRDRTGPLSVLLMRLENFDVLTDHLGRAGIGHLLVSICMRLNRAMRPEDPVQIIAPGVFAVVVSDRCEIEAMRIASRLQREVQRPVAASGRTVAPVLTGVMVHANADASAELADMIEDARHRLERLDAEGLGNLRLYSHDPQRITDAIPACVADAVADGQIIAYFQPQLCCHTGKVTGFEALARWNHPVHGILPPAAFMPKMTEADHAALTLSMLRQSLAALQRWDSEGRDVPTVALNISNCELGDSGFAASLLWELDRQNIPTNRLVLELLESVGPVTATSEARANLEMLSKAGCRLDLDDFGTGYASLDAIRLFGVHRIKIDRSFVMGCDIDPGQQRMILAILALAEHLGVATLAEGVETSEEHAFLAQMGCDQVQGYSIARPLPLEEACAFLDDHARRAESMRLMPPRKAG